MVGCIIVLILNGDLMLNLYEKYLSYVESTLLNKYFAQQKDYIFCKEGCDLCCKNGEYPFSDVEFKYLMLGFEFLDENTKNIIRAKIDDIKKQKETSTQKPFVHECPFLINKRCSVYAHRGLICRTHGLLFFITDENGKTKNKMPYCVNLGLNYSNVYDEKTKTISSELWEKSKIEAEPVAYNISLKALMKNEAAEYLGLEFKELRALIDWFE